MVLAAYRSEHPDNLDPKPSTLVAYETNLENVYLAELQKQAAARGIDPNKFNLSMLVFFAVQSGASKVSTRIDHACIFFLSVKTVP
jgi:hypothetical protein